MEGVSYTTIGTTKSLVVIVSTNFLQLWLNLGQFLVNPVVEILTGFLNRQFAIKCILERCLVEEIKEIIVVQAAEETNLCNDVIAHLTCLFTDELVVKGDVVCQALVCPVGTYRT